MKKLLLGLSLLVSSFSYAGSNAELADWHLYLDRRGCVAQEYDDLYIDSIAIKHILQNMIATIDDETIMLHIESYLNYIGTYTAHVLLADIKDVGL